MIEVEKKFFLTKEDEERLCQGAHFLKRIEYRDIYFDTPDYKLTKQDQWLRQRNGSWELKIAITKEVQDDRVVDQYREIEEGKAIRGHLGIEEGGSFEEDLRVAGYIPFCVLDTERRKYAKDHFIIDLDRVTAENFEYDVGEIELMVEEASQVPMGVEKIKTFAQAQGLVLTHVRGKVMAYIKEQRPAHYEALVAAGIIRK